MSAYAASKAHALSFAEGFAREVSGDGIAVLALCPGPTSTEIWPEGATPSLPMRASGEFLFCAEFATGKVKWTDPAPKATALCLAGGASTHAGNRAMSF